mmetsp:Transcript_50031/g.150512  ORF Transcript_50031/g.150512 Transcript_50031/m.150512 type:complete len:413 (-) Transcript_50031:159-1397(-)
MSSPPSPRDAVIVAAVRTPLCRARKGALAGTPPSTLLTAALRGVLSGAGGPGQPPCPPSAVEDVCVGNVLSPVSGAVGARMAQLAAGIPHTASLSTVNRQCSSGLQAVANIANAIASGQIEVGIGAGVESMSTHNMAKMPPPDVDWEAMKGAAEAMECLVPMGVTSENVSKKYGLRRADLDAFAAESHRRASAAQAGGKFDEEIVPVLVTRDGGSAFVSRDDGIRPGTTASVLSKLRPVFDRETGSTTAGNSSQMTDGAAAVLLMSRAEAERRGVAILAVWRSFAVRGVPPAVMGVGPAVAIPVALDKSGILKEDVDVYEINEAFASQASWCVRELGLDAARVNPNGGAIALGHPLGCTGARQIATLIQELLRQGGRYGVVSMCIGTGMGAAAVIEMESRSPNSKSKSKSNL